MVKHQTVDLRHIDPGRNQVAAGRRDHGHTGALRRRRRWRGVSVQCEGERRTRCDSESKCRQRGIQYAPASRTGLGQWVRETIHGGGLNCAEKAQYLDSGSATPNGNEQRRSRRLAMLNIREEVDHVDTALSAGLHHRHEHFLRPRSPHGAVAS